MKNLVLVGFSGCGKTTIGKKIAQQLHLDFVDLDAVIEKKYHITIPHLFQKYGEFVFRQCEYQILNEQLAETNKLIATGGGTPCFQDAMQKINENSLSVYIQMSENALVNRLMHSKKIRPLTHKKTEEQLIQYVHETLQIRAPYYELAAITISGENPNIANITELLKNKYSL